MKRVINFPNRGKVDQPAAEPAEEVKTIEIPKRPSFIPKKYAVEWAEMCIELMGRQRWSNSMMPLLEAAMVGRVVFDETHDLMEKLEAQKVIFKYYRLLDLIPKRDPGHPGRPRLNREDDKPHEGLPAEPTTRWG